MRVKEKGFVGYPKTVPMCISFNHSSSRILFMENIPDEIRSGGPEFLHKLSQLTLELLSDRDEGEFSCPGVLGPLPGVVVVLEESPDEILLALLGYGFQTGVEGVIVLLYEVGRLEICIEIKTQPPTPQFSFPNLAPPPFSNH